MPHTPLSSNRHWSITLFGLKVENYRRLFVWRLSLFFLFCWRAFAALLLLLRLLLRLVLLLFWLLMAPFYLGMGRNGTVPPRAGLHGNGSKFSSYQVSSAQFKRYALRVRTYVARLCGEVLPVSYLLV